jgi:uncharacterized NAD(P)/FAD-binding protein YdhS
MESRTDLLIVGGGFSGTTLVANLARLVPSIDVTLVERAPIGQFGMAYRTKCSDHVLNVPAGGMSAFVDLPNDFIDWAANQGESLSPSTFAPRALYSQYLNSLLTKARSKANLNIVHDEVTAISRDLDGWTCTTRDGSTILAKLVVLAFGNCFPILPSELRALEGHPTLVVDPWAAISIQPTIGLDRVGIIGTGLTAVDVILSFEGLGFKGKYDLISRHGLLPNPHRSGVSPLPIDSVPKPQNSVRNLFREFRQTAKTASESGSDWRALFDAIRPRVSDYWLALDAKQRRRFISHCRVFWDVHRHRTPPDADAVIKDLIRTGRVSIIKGKLLNSAPIGDTASVDVILDGACGVKNFQWDLVFNCTGSPARVSTWSSRLVSSLQSSGIATIDETEMGFVCDDSGRVIDGNGLAHPDLFLLGILRRGQLWESTAVPDLRKQAHALAENLVPIVS